MKSFSLALTLSFLWLSFAIPSIKGQEDTVIFEKSTEAISNSDFNIKQKYNYKDIKFKEEKTLLKIGINSFNSFVLLNNTSGKTLNGVIAIEQKINPSWTILFQKQYNYNKVNSQGLDVFRNRRISFDISMRYYHSMKKKIKTGTSANNFHASYISFQLKDIFTLEKGITPYYSGTYVPYNSNIEYRNYRRKEFAPYLNISYGIQRRIGSWGYFDASLFCGLDEFEFKYGLNIVFGLGWGFTKE